MNTISKISALTIACAVFLSTISTVHSEILDPPNTPLVTVSEIGTNWVKLDVGVTNLLGTTPFEGDNPEHMNQVHELGDYVCRLNNRRGVVLSQITETTVTGNVRSYHYFFLVACALP